MKKAAILSFILAALLALSACNSADLDNSSYTQTNSGAGAAASSSSSQPEEAPSGEAPSSDSSEPESTPASSQNSSAASSKPPSSSTASSVIVSAAPDSLKESPRAAEAYFDDAVFIGDSIANKLKLYVTKQRKAGKDMLGKAQFLTIGNMGSGNTQKDLADKNCIVPTYNGTRMHLEDSVAAMGTKKVYIMLGMNDIGLYGVDGSVENMTKLLGKIKAKNPGAAIFVQSTTPIVTGREKKVWNNANIEKYNAKMVEVCTQNGYYYVDVSSVMKDSGGGLLTAYCSEPQGMGVHFSDKGCQTWVDYLYTHTA